MKRLSYTSTCLLLAGTLFTTTTLAGNQVTNAPQADKSVATVKEKSSDKAAGERKRILEDAVTALARTNLALRHLDSGDRDKALDDLSIAIGKLETVVAARPELALAPVDVQIITLDLYGDVDTVHKTVKKAKELIEKDRIQQARHLLKDLASEVIVRVTNIPLATYPKAIKAMIPLIDQGKVKEAKKALEAALSTLVVVDHISPLPVMRAQQFLDQAAKLADKPKRSKEENRKLKELLDKAGKQLELAEALGYGTREDYRPMYALLEKIREKTAGGNTGHGDLFASLKERLEQHLESFWNEKH